MLEFVYARLALQIGSVELDSVSNVFHFLFGFFFCRDSVRIAVVRVSYDMLVVIDIEAGGEPHSTPLPYFEMPHLSVCSLGRCYWHYSRRWRGVYLSGMQWMQRNIGALLVLVLNMRV